MSIVRTEAFVLKAVRYGETSVICRLFTPDRGVVPVIAKGARRPKSRFGAALEPFQRLAILYHAREGREIQTLSGVELLAAHRGVAGSLERLEAAGAWFRFLRGVLPEGAPARPLYELAAAALPRLESTPAARARRWETYHRAAAATLLGIEPQLESCTACGRPLRDGVGAGAGFSTAEGGAVCSDCRPGRRGIRVLSTGEISVLALYHQPDYGLLLELESLAGEEARVQELVHEFIRYHADSRGAA